jgi:uncharacterized membrane protein SpoIIM required for sporulation
VIIDTARFVGAERPYWDELAKLLEQLKNDPERRLSFEEVQRFHYLYERSSADLSRVGTFSADPHLRRSLEALVAQAYAQIHETRAPIRVRWKNLLTVFPQAFRRHAAAFQLAVAATLIGALFGGFAIRQDPRAKAVLMPFPGLMLSPADRVKQEESAKNDRMQGHKASFSAELMTHNIRVTMFAMAAGITWGAGTLILLFYNGVLLGAVVADYVAGGQSAFLAGWLLPHGSIEIPAILIGGQAGFVLASALIGWGTRETRAERFRAVSHDLFALIGGAAVMLIWAGAVESFVSQYHQPVLPYALKIGFGACELVALTAFLWLVGRE